ncbi:unnamed protein product [Spirodela intermedia]|uniref:Uncharacterized protein n=1 Tax=Spirodela intermedia TaxID=51605 RepID=A0A7I8LLR7_SPIIN|nr:unnamed protein product [Spirodela intermedia]
MGNKLGKRRYVVDEKYTRPQGLYEHMDVDRKKLRKLILDSKLAPCYPGDEESTLDLEECPICFLYYPSLNRSRCCMKGICTECFLQMKPPHSTCPTSCPFCKTSNYAVEYRGMRTKEERGLEEMEEQKVLEAKIRMQQQERKDEEERLRKRQSLCSSNRGEVPGEVESCEMPSSPIPEPSFAYAIQQGEVFVSCEVPCPPSAVNWPSHSRQNRYEDLGMDLENTMTTEALWHGSQATQEMIPPCGGGMPSQTPLAAAEYFYAPPHAVMDASSPCSPSTSGLPCAIAIGPPAERNLAVGVYLPPPPYGWMVEWPGGGVATPLQRGESTWGLDNGCYSGVATDYRLPENLEEQMMLAMAVSLTEARGRSNSSSQEGTAWLM